MNWLRRAIRWIAKGAAYEGPGFSVSLQGAFGVLYSEPGRQMRITGELFYDESNNRYRGLYINQVHWDPPYEYLVIDEAKRREIRDRVREALDHWKQPFRFIED